MTDTSDSIDVRVRLRDARRFKTDATGVSTSVDKIGKAGEHASKNLDKTTRSSRRGLGPLRKLGAAALITGAGLLSIGAAKNAIDTTIGLAKSTKALNQNLGFTNIEANRWAVAAKARGIDTSTLSLSFTNLSKNAVAAAGGSRKHASALQREIANLDAREKRIKDAIAGGRAQQVLNLAHVSGNKAATASLRARGIVELADLRRQGALIKARKTAATQQLAALKGNKGSIAAFRALGISQKELQAGARPGGFQGLLNRVADGLARMPGGARKAAIAQKLLGRSTQTTLPIFAKGSKAMNANLRLADKYGVLLTGKTAPSLQELITAQKELEIAQLGWQVTFATKVAPAITKLIFFFTRGTLWLRRHKTAAHFGAIAVGVLGGALLLAKGAMALYNSQLASGVKALWKYLFVTKNAAGATRVATAAQWLLNLAMEANPVFVIITALVLLGVALFILWKKSATFRRIVTGAFHGVQRAASFVWNWIKGHWPLLLAILTGPIGLAVLFIIRHWDRILGVVKGLKHRIGKAAGGMWDGIKNAFRSAVNWILRKWNNLHFGMKAKKVAGHTVIPGFDFKTPNIALLGGGGTIFPGGRAIVGDTGPELASLVGGRVQVEPLSGTPGGSGFISALLALAERPVVLKVDGREIAIANAKAVSRRTARR